MAKLGKKYQEVAKLVDSSKKYSLVEAVELAKQTSTTKFDATVELVFRLNLDSRKAEQNLRGAIVLPHGTGTTRKVLVLTKGPKAKEAQEAGNYEAQKTDLEFTQDMKEFIADHYNVLQKTYRDIDIVVDPAAASFILQMRRFHMKSKKGNNEVLTGIRTVATLINERKLKVCDRCSNYIHEVHTYSWDAKAQARGRNNPCPLL